MVNDFLRNNSNAFLQMGAGLLGGRTAPEQVSMGLQGFAGARQQQQQTNKTVQWLQQAEPELAQAVQQGIMAPGDAFKLAYERKLQAQAPVKPLEVNGRLVDPSTYEVLADFSDGPKQNGITQDIMARQQAATGFGLTPESPAYQSYVLTGKMPREDAQPLTATDKKAILEADELAATNEGAITTIDQALAVNKRANSGFGAGARATIGAKAPDWLVPDMVSSPESSQATIDYDNLVMNQALQQLKTIFGGNPTEGERAILLDLQASSDKPPEVRERILLRAKALAERRLEFNRQRASELRGGTYYKPSGGPANGPRQTSSGVTWSVD